MSFLLKKEGNRKMEKEAREEDDSTFSYNIVFPPFRNRLRKTEWRLRNEREENYLPFSYNLVRPLFRNRPEKTTWNVIEKGSDKSNPIQKYEISYSTIKSALVQMKDHIKISPCDELQIKLFEERGFHIFLKNEMTFQGTIKRRGIIYALKQLSQDQKSKGVVAISHGSFAMILCITAKEFEIPVTVVMPRSSSNIIKDRCRDLGATVIDDVRSMIKAHDRALKYVQETGRVYLDRNDHPDMIIGQSTLGMEIVEEMEDIDAVILPTMIIGCGLTAGLAIAIKERKPSIKVIEVRTTNSDRLINNIRKRANSSNELDVPVTEYVWHKQFRDILDYCFDKKITIQTKFFTEAFHLIKAHDFEDLNIGYSGPIGLGAILSGQLDELKRKRVVIPIFGRMEWVDTY